MQNYLAYIKKRFKTVAPVYDFSFMPIRSIRKLTTGFADAKKGEKALDICTGTGEIAIGLAKAGASVTGIDISEDMLRIARKKDLDGKIEFMQADATNLPFENGLFDLAVISFGLHEMPRDAIISAIAEAKRVLKKDGRMVITEYVPKKRYTDNKILKFFGYSFLYLYECRFFPDYINCDIQNVLGDAGFIVRRRENTILDFMEVLVCEPV